MFDELIETLDSVFFGKTFFEADVVKIDSIFFRALTKHTAIVFLLCLIANVICLYFTGPIECISDKELDYVIDSYCWITAMYTLPDLQAKSEQDAVLMPYPGVRQERPSDNKIFHRFYQYTYLMLLLQVVLFCGPRCLWKMLEDGRVQSVKEQIDKIGFLTLDDVQNFNYEEIANVDDVEATEEENEQRKKKQKMRTVVNFVNHMLDHNKSYFLYFLLCEFLAIANIFLQMFAMVYFFLGMDYLTFGYDFILSQIDYFQKTNPMATIFPKMSKCTMNSVGPSGNIVKHDALCVLSINVVNEKIYLVLWFWCATVLCFNLIGLYRIPAVFSWRLRNKLLRWKLHKKAMDSTHLRKLRHISVSDWFFLKLIRRNVDAIPFTFLIANLSNDRIVGVAPKQLEESERMADPYLNPYEKCRKN